MRTPRPLAIFALAFTLAGQLPTATAVQAAPSEFTLPQALHYPYATQLAAAEHHEVIAWVRNFEGARNIWVARGPAFNPIQVTVYADDDGQEITQLVFTADAEHVIYVRGGDHDANWPAEGNLAPNPASSVEQPLTTIWSVATAGGAPVKVAEGDSPVVSSRDQLAYLQDDHVWTQSLDGQGKPERLFFDRGKDSDPRWSPDGSRLGFVSDRGDHAFIGIFKPGDQTLTYLAASTDSDSSPRWSPDSSQVAFVRRPGNGGPPEPILKQVPHPWSLWTANATDGSGHLVWSSPETLSGSFPDLEQGSDLRWAAGGRLVFLAYLDDWPHLYSVSVGGGAPVLLTPGPFMVEHIALSADRRSVIYDANTGNAAGDLERRHVFRVAVDRAGSSQLTSGSTLEWSPVGTTGDHVAFISAGVQQPPAVGFVSLNGSSRPTQLAARLPADFPLGQFLVPRPVTFKAADGALVHGQVFERPGAPVAGRSKPGIIFVHGGPPRQMLLGWHYMEYYSNAYAVNQYLAAQGFAVLSVNYRLGIGYGRAFHQPDHAGPLGAAEYQDVVAGARFLQTLPGVDGRRIGIWGGSYGGYLTALALARNSDLFKAGVDLHGVHDWSRLPDNVFNKVETRYEKGDRDDAIRLAWESSPDSALAGWKSPVLLIQGDDDRNVPFQQTIDLARRLKSRHVPVEELVLPNEIHGFLRHAAWLRADAATVEFLTRNLAAGATGTE